MCFMKIFAKLSSYSSIKVGIYFSCVGPSIIGERFWPKSKIALVTSIIRRFERGLLAIFRFIFNFKASLALFEWKKSANMTYNGIGLQTARGSGTNGYVQANLANVFLPKV